MERLNYIKSEIQRLYKTNPNIHVNVKASRTKLAVESSAAVIKSVHSKFFRIEETSSGYAKCHSVQYAEVLTGNVVILELDSQKKE